MDVIGTLGLDTLTFLVATVIVIPFFRSFKASPILGFLLSGVALNQLGLIRNISDVKALSELGILFLLFEMGLELSIERLRALAKFAFGMGLPQVLLTTLAFAAFELPPNNAIGTRLLGFEAPSESLTIAHRSSPHFPSPPSNSPLRVSHRSSPLLTALPLPSLQQVLLTTLAFAAFELPPDHAIGTRMLEWAASARPDLVNIRSVDEAIVIGAALSLSSSAFVLQLLSEKGELATRLLSEKGELATRVGSATLGILLLQDIAVVPLLVILPILESGVSASSQPSDAAFEMVVVSGTSQNTPSFTSDIAATPCMCFETSQNTPSFTSDIAVTPCMCFETSQNTPSFTSDIAATPCMCFETSQNTPSFTSDIAVTPCMCFETSQNTPSFTSDIAATPCMCFETSQNTPSFTSDIAVTPCMCFETSQNTPSFTSDIAATPCMCFETSQNAPSFTSDIAVTPCMCFETSQNTPSFTSDIAATPCMCFETSQNTPSFTSDIAVTPCMCFETSQNTPSFTSDIAVTPCMCFETSQNTPSFSSDIAATPCMCFETSQNTPSFTSDIAVTPCMCFETSQNTPSFTSDIAATPCMCFETSQNTPSFTSDIAATPCMCFETSQNTPSFTSDIAVTPCMCFETSQNTPSFTSDIAVTPCMWPGSAALHGPVLSPYLSPSPCLLPITLPLPPLPSTGFHRRQSIPSARSSGTQVPAGPGLAALLCLALPFTPTNTLPSPSLSASPQDFTDGRQSIPSASSSSRGAQDFTDDSLFPLLAAAGLKSLLGVGVLLYTRAGSLPYTPTNNPLTSTSPCASPTGFHRRQSIPAPRSSGPQVPAGPGSAALHGQALSQKVLRLGAFLAGVLLAETNYRTQVEGNGGTMNPNPHLLSPLLCSPPCLSCLPVLAARSVLGRSVAGRDQLPHAGGGRHSSLQGSAAGSSFESSQNFTPAGSLLCLLLYLWRQTFAPSGVEADIRPFRGLLLGLFFVTTGTSIDLSLLAAEWPNILLLLAGLIAIKTAIITALGPRVGLSLPESIRTGLLLSQGGEFAFVVFALASQ
ncbi:unnamed protein product [Closterium sp. NIES-65]|nr:unnamed protein product [Closterium sp. NIES-65]